jgi:hypothetical protein
MGMMRIWNAFGEQEVVTVVRVQLCGGVCV